MTPPKQNPFSVREASDAPSAPTKHRCNPQAKQVDDPAVAVIHGKGAWQASCKGCGCETAVRTTRDRALRELAASCPRGQQ